MVVFFHAKYLKKKIHSKITENHILDIIIKGYCIFISEKNVFEQEIHRYLIDYYV